MPNCPSCLQPLPDKHKHVSDGKVFATVTYQNGTVKEKTRCAICPATITREVKKKCKSSQVS